MSARDGTSTLIIPRALELVDHVEAVLDNRATAVDLDEISVDVGLALVYVLLDVASTLEAIVEELQERTP